jgi:hypothetical protein
MSVWSDIRRIRSDGRRSQAINLGKANEFIDNLESGKLARVSVEDDRVVIEVLEFADPEPTPAPVDRGPGAGAGVDTNE